MLCLSCLFSSASARGRALWRLVGGALLVIALSPLATWAAPEKIHKSQRKLPPLQESTNAGDVGQLPRQVEAALQNAKVPREALHVFVIDPQSSATPRLLSLIHI